MIIFDQIIHMKILKFGGTSVGTAERIKNLVHFLNKGEKQIVVLSAMSGTTNVLVDLSQSLQQEDKIKAVELIDSLESKYRAVIQDLFSTPKYHSKGEELIKEHFNFLRSFLVDMFTPKEAKAILAQGELLSTALFHFYCEELGISTFLLPALDFMRLNKDGEPDIEYISKHLKPLLEKEANKNIFITQGFICRNPFGEIDNLKRGGSDYTASLIGAAIKADEIQIWTDIDGMHNNDPRIVKNTSPIAQLSFDEAAELAYFGAKILHPQSVLPARAFHIPVRLLNTMDPKAAGTLISLEKKGDPIKAIAAKDGITAIKIQSSRMLLAYGFLRRVFEIFERYKTPIDMITTSEVAVSLTIDDDSQLNEIVKELNEFCSVEVDQNQTIVCIVGDFKAEKSGVTEKVFSALNQIPIRMISYGGSPHNVSVLIQHQHKASALEALHKGLFN